MCKGIEMYGNSIPAGAVGGDLFEYINFQQRYDIDARIQRALKRSKEYPRTASGRRSVTHSVDKPCRMVEIEAGLQIGNGNRISGRAKFGRQVRVAEDLHELYSTAGVLWWTPEGHGIISAKIASTVHDTFHALMLAELDYRGKTTPELFERINLRWHSPSPLVMPWGEARKRARRNCDHALRRSSPLWLFSIREFWTSIPPLVFSAEYRKFMDIDKSQMVQFLPLGLQLPKMTRIATGTFPWNPGRGGQNPRMWQS